jgi:hypothetical protein
MRKILALALVLLAQPLWAQYIGYTPSTYPKLTSQQYIFTPTTTAPTNGLYVLTAPKSLRYMQDGSTLFSVFNGQTYFYGASVSLVLNSDVSLTRQSGALNIGATQVLLPSGTTALPGAAWAAAPTHGFAYSSGTTLTYYSYAGVPRLAFGSAGLYDFSGYIYFGASNDVLMGRIAADHLGVMRSTNAETLSVAGTFTDASNNTLLSLAGSSDGFRIATAANGTGAASPTDGLVAIQGSKSVALSEGSATTVGTISIADGQPFLGKALFGAYCSDGTDFVARTGEIVAACSAKSGTVTCSDYATIDSTDAASGGASFTAFTVALAGGSNDASLTIDATCSLTQTTLDGYVTWHNLTDNGVLPGT